MAIELLAQHPLDLVLLRVASDPEGANEAQQSLDDVTDRLARSPVAVTPVVAFGRPEQEIVRCADQRGADLIAMSTHGRSMVARMLVGSVTDRVIRTSPVPVMVLHPPTMSLGRVSPPTGRKLRVMAPLDGSAFAEEAVRMAVSLLNPELIELSLACVVGTPERETPVARGILDEVATRLAKPGLGITTTILTGAAAGQINGFAIEGGYDLVVMSTHGHGMLTRALVGSVTDRVVRTSEVPILVIQPQSMETPFDPVGGEDVDPDTAAYTSEYHGRTFSFTSFEHKQQFESDPEAYVGRRLDHPVGYSSPSEAVARDRATVPPMAREV
jgi:nucleotide-binding universal stress UspA family protein/YHS domain-containing protein